MWRWYLLFQLKKGFEKQRDSNLVGIAEGIFPNLAKPKWCIGRQKKKKKKKKRKKIRVVSELGKTQLKPKGRKEGRSKPPFFLFQQEKRRRARVRARSLQVSDSPYNPSSFGGLGLENYGAWCDWFFLSYHRLLLPCFNASKAST